MEIVFDFFSKKCRVNKLLSSVIYSISKSRKKDVIIGAIIDGIFS